MFEILKPAVREGLLRVIREEKSIVNSFDLTQLKMSQCVRITKVRLLEAIKGFIKGF